MLKSSYENMCSFEECKTTTTLYSTCFKGPTRSIKAHRQNLQIKGTEAEMYKNAHMGGIQSGSVKHTSLL